MGVVAKLQDGPGASKKKVIMIVGGVCVLALVAVGAVFVAGGKKAEKQAETSALPAQPVTAEKPAPPPAAEPAKAQPVAEKAAENPEPTAVPPPVAEKAEPAEKKIAAEKPGKLAAVPAVGKPGEKKVVEKALPAERPVAKSAPSPKPAAEKPVADKPKPVAALPKPEKKPAEVVAPAAKPAVDKTREAAEAYQRGNAKLLSGAFPEAIAAFTEALKLNPKDAQSQRGLGQAYAQAGKAPMAVRHFKLYLKASPNAPDRALIEKRIDQLGGR